VIFFNLFSSDGFSTATNFDAFGPSTTPSNTSSFPASTVTFDDFAASTNSDGFDAFGADERCVLLVFGVF
jgi:hypothetical protein